MTIHDSALTITDLRKSYSGVPAVRGVDLNIEPGEFVTLLGPSGCGKTTLLRCVAGLERIDHGRIALGDRVLSDARTGQLIRPARRNVGMVFQNYALWPHMTVEQNVMYPLRMRGADRRTARTTARTTLDLVELSRFAARPVGNLSGGQQQRVALARAVVAHPDLMLFDEPLSNLDASLRESMRQYVIDAHRAAGCLSVYVTHDQSEALSLSDRIAVMFDGTVRQTGTPNEVYRRPADQRVARFLGFDNFLEGTVVTVDGDRAEVQLTGPVRLVATPTAPIVAGDAVQVGVRSNHFEIIPDDDAPADSNEWSGVVRRVRNAQSVVDLDVHCAGATLTVRVLDVARGDATVSRAEGDAIRVRVAPEFAVVLPSAEQSTADVPVTAGVERGA
ncbi:ABC transporter ATP-binding protein [Jiangella asiatica]|uniref:ABC transporter ATP-binding protein n=1 Tax=Jiangella asiatica TaxID=2530372 RepID=A0A4R5D631_9ACTN|nr:ABC transporter ATP-binding protein [Jiangella asiatica]TDE08027.1 ABC transporter ATP-binding protein [Jiangella asiatica]